MMFLFWNLERHGILLTDLHRDISLLLLPDQDNSLVLLLLWKIMREQ